MKKVDNSSAVLIHRRTYRDSSLLLDFYTKDYGKIRLIGRGIRKSKTNIQMFQKLNIFFSGKGELKILTQWEFDDLPRTITGDALIMCMYINELFSIIIHENDAHPELFDIYINFINTIATLDKKSQQWSLRLFESNLLDELGYGVDYSVDTSGNKIVKNKSYEYQQHQGFSAQSSGKISGKLLASLLINSLDELPDDIQLKVCRNLNRQRLSVLLGKRELKSRELFFKV
jgi:DNA repair protein RecO (recombination protein O)